MLPFLSLAFINFPLNEVTLSWFRLWWFEKAEQLHSGQEFFCHILYHEILNRNRDRTLIRCVIVDEQLPSFQSFNSKLFGADISQSSGNQRFRLEKTLLLCVEN